MKLKAMTIEEIEAEIDAEIESIRLEAHNRSKADGEEFEELFSRTCTPYHWTPWYTIEAPDDLGDHQHIFGENCKWKHEGFDGFMDDFGSFRYLPGNC